MMRCQQPLKAANGQGIKVPEPMGVPNNWPNAPTTRQCPTINFRCHDGQGQVCAIYFAQVTKMPGSTARCNGQTGSAKMCEPEFTGQVQLGPIPIATMTASENKQRFEEVPTDKVNYPEPTSTQQGHVLSEGTGGKATVDRWGKGSKEHMAALDTEMRKIVQEYRMCMVKNTRKLSTTKSNQCCLSEGFYRSCRSGDDPWSRSRRSGEATSATIKRCLCEKKARDTGCVTTLPVPTCNEEEELLKKAAEQRRTATERTELGEATKTNVDPNFKCPGQFTEFATATNEIDVSAGVKLLVRTKDCKCSITAGAGCIMRACGPRRNQGYTSMFSAVPVKSGGNVALTAAENQAAQAKIGEQYKIYQASRKGLSIAIQESSTTGKPVAQTSSGQVFGRLCTDAQAAAATVPAVPVDNSATCQAPTGFKKQDGTTALPVPSYIKTSQGCGTSNPVVNEWLASAAPTQQNSLLDTTVIQTTAFMNEVKSRLVFGSTCAGDTLGFTDANTYVTYGWYEEKVFSNCKLHTANQVAMALTKSSGVTGPVVKLSGTESTESSFNPATCPANADPARL